MAPTWVGMIYEFHLRPRAFGMCTPSGAAPSGIIIISFYNNFYCETIGVDNLT